MTATRHPRRHAGDHRVTAAATASPWPCSSSLAVVLQTAVFGLVAVDGVVPDLALVVVVAAALVRGPEFGAGSASWPGCWSTWRRRPTTSPAAGRWRSWWSATSPAGCGSERRSSPVGAVLTVAACSFVGTSIFALSGLLLHDPAMPGRRDGAGDPARRALRRADRPVRAAACCCGCSDGSSPPQVDLLMAAVLIRPHARPAQEPAAAVRACRRWCSRCS